MTIPIKGVDASMTKVSGGSRMNAQDMPEEEFGRVSANNEFENSDF